jgi:hypothetical protein
MNTPRRSGNVDQPQFERLPLSELRQGRHGKHHDLASRVAREIEALADGEALKIPVDSMDVSLANLRSAVSRAMTSRGVKIGTFSDGESLFVWRKTAGTARYERKRGSRQRKQPKGSGTSSL